MGSLGQLELLGAGVFFVIDQGGGQRPLPTPRSKQPRKGQVDNYNKTNSQEGLISVVVVIIVIIFIVRVDQGISHLDLPGGGHKEEITAAKK